MSARSRFPFLAALELALCGPQEDEVRSALDELDALARPVGYDDMGCPIYEHPAASS